MVSSPEWPMLWVMTLYPTCSRFEPPALLSKCCIYLPAKARVCVCEVVQPAVASLAMIDGGQ
eukprot:1190251-Amphidinium_carterae.1